MKVVEWWQKREKEKKQKKLLTAAQKLEARRIRVYRRKDYQRMAQ